MAVLAPLAMVTLLGTVSDARLLDNTTVAPSDPATLVSVTVHVEVPPAVRLLGVQESRLTTPGAIRVRDAVCELPL